MESVSHAWYFSGSEEMLNLIDVGERFCG